jgi:hypothetical protein
MAVSPRKAPQHRRVRIIRSLVLSVALVSVAPASAFAHGSHGAGSAAVGHAGARISTIEPDETLKLSVDLFGYLTASMASGGRTGEPLGAGGKMSLFYNQRLHRESPFDRAGLAQKDYWPQYRDFSYNPLWTPSQLGVRAQYRFLPEVQGAITAAYFGTLDRPTVEPGPLELEELLLRWRPSRVPGLSITLGRLFLLGSYSPLFDQFPLEGFRFNGAAVDYRRPLGSAAWRVRLAGGKTPLGRTTAIENFDPDPLKNHLFLDAGRERTHLYGTAGLETSGGLFVGVLGGYQLLPEAESTSNDPFLVTARWPRATGWQGGVELGLVRGPVEQRLVLVHGYGDVEMGWSGPDFVLVADPAASQDRLLRRGSALSQVVYWGAVSTRSLRLGLGAWGQWRRPAKEPHVWELFDPATQGFVPVALVPQDFRAAKVALEPAYRRGPLTVGVRLDGFHYFDKGATTNSIEPLTDEALRPVFVDPNSAIPNRVVGASRWEREAVDCLVVSPIVEWQFGEVVRLRGSWSGAWYTKPVRRQQIVSDFHANVTLAVWLVYRVGVPETTP